MNVFYNLIRLFDCEVSPLYFRLRLIIPSFLCAAQDRDFPSGKPKEERLSQLKHLALTTLIIPSFLC